MVQIIKKVDAKDALLHPDEPLIDDSRDGGCVMFLQVPRPDGNAEIHKGETLLDKYALALAPTLMAGKIAKAQGHELPRPADFAEELLGLAQAIIAERRRRLYGATE